MVESINSHLIGTQSALARLHTPALIIDSTKMNANSELMREHCQRQGISLRPHTKTHKSVAIAKKQMQDGAIGICTAKLGEAEVMVEGGIPSVLITSPVAKLIDIERVVRLTAKAEELIVVVDNIENVRALEETFSAAQQTLDVLVDLDSGMHRTGVYPDQQALEIAQYLVNSSHLQFLGVQMYAGNLMHVRSYEERHVRSLEKMQELRDFCELLAKHRIECSIRTGGGTGTFNIDPQAGILTDLQAGSYLFMDRQYCAVEGLPFEPSLFVASTVISANTPGIATVDAGLKSFATDDEVPLLHAGLEFDVDYVFMGDEHGGLVFDGGNETIPLGTVVQLLTPHCDPTFNLYDCAHLIEDGTLIQIVLIDARGRSY